MPLSRHQPLRSNPDAVRAWKKRSKPLRARRRKPPPASVRNVVIERCHGLCEVCGTWVTPGTHAFHHRHRKSQGGPDTADNLLYCHNLPCHIETIHRHPKRAYEMGWLVRSTEAQP